MPVEAGQKYQLIELAGSGGMARVYRGHTVGAGGFRRPVAIKRILDHLGHNPEFVAMFVEEARVASEIHHPNVVQIHDFDQDDQGAYYLVMEWVPGLNMLDWSRAHLLNNRHVPWHLVAAIAIEVLKGLGAAHERTDGNGRRAPIYHRDVTPQNVLLSDGGYIKLTDFGLARAMDRAPMTQPHIVKGKVSYLAPELTEGDAVSPQSDMYSLGIVLWEALTGEKLFDGEDPVDVLQAIRAGHVPSVRAHRPDVPDAFADVLNRALAKERGARFRSTRGMTRALANILRMTPESTDADVIARSVHEARGLLQAAHKRQEEAVPLTRRKP